MAKQIVLYGVTGFIGSGLANLLAEQGYEITGVSRQGPGNLASVKTWVKPEEVNLSGCDIVINLAGVPIDQRWTEEKKKLFHKSRIGVTKDIVERIANLPKDERPSVLLNASAIGIYGDRGDDLLDESAPPGNGYLAELCKEWESSTEQATALGLRVIRFRIGVVLGQEGRTYKRLCRVFRAGIGGRLGSGKQWMPWIHVKDLRRAILFCISHDSMDGAVNATAPEPERNSDLTRKLAKSLHRWVFFPVPRFALKALLGEFGDALLQSQRATPEKLKKHGFTFRFRKLEETLDDLRS